MTRGKTITAALALPLVLVGSLASAQGGRHHGGPGGPGGRDGRGPMFGALRLLDLSDDQRTAVRDLVTRQHESAKPLLDEMRQLHQQQEAALAEAKPDASRIGNLAIQQSKLHDQLKAEHQKLQDAIGALLTPEQKELWSKAQAAHQKQRERFRQRHQDAPDSAN
jgi:Spy/CpxP family protein refolding chaperone